MLTLRTTLTLTILLGAPRMALACPVCFGENNSPMATAMNAGILFMLGVVAAILTGFASFIVYLIRRGRIAAALDPVTALTPADARAGVRSNPQEGTA